MLQETELGVNRTGMDRDPEAAAKMMENIELTKPASGDEQEMSKLRGEYIGEAEPVGSIPKADGSAAQRMLMDKLGERLAFERSGTRLYDALIGKCQAMQDESVPLDELQEHREEEARHFALVGAAIQSLGGDPTLQTPSADVAGVEGMGLMQVLTDPKTTLAQGLHAVLVAEMTDTAGWEELVELATEAKVDEDIIGRFQSALQKEEEHLEEVRGWYKNVSTQSRQ